MRAIILLAALPLLFGERLQAQEDGFAPLFNGRDLSGWVEMGAPGAFVVEEGALVLRNPQNHPNWLRSEREYENFVLKLEYQTLGWSETGIYLHAPLYGKPVQSGLKIHLRHDRADEGARSTGALYDVRAPITFANRPGDAWNRLEIRMDWPELRVLVNDTVVQDVNLALSDELRWRLGAGYLGFEDIGTRIRYRNIQIQELPGSERAWTELFNGRDLTGWQASGQADWRVVDGALVGGGSDGVLATEASFGSFELQTYFRTSPHANGGIFYRMDERPDQPSHYEIQIYNVPTATNPTGSIYGIAPARDAGCRSGEWCLMQLISDGAYSRVLIDGETVAEAARLALPDAGRIGLQNHSKGRIEYRRIRIRSLGKEE